MEPLPVRLSQCWVWKDQLTESAQGEKYALHSLPPFQTNTQHPQTKHYKWVGFLFFFFSPYWIVLFLYSIFGLDNLELSVFPLLLF